MPSDYQRPPDWPLLEGLVTTAAPTPADAPLADRVNIAPMGPVVAPDFSRFILRPFKTSTTYRNLAATGEAVFHITDDALLLARAAIGRVQPSGALSTRPAERVAGLVLLGACRYYELRVERADESGQRALFEMSVAHAGRLRDFVGFHRARHAVLEAAILATRVHLTGPQPVLGKIDELAVLVEKTGTPAEAHAIDELRRHVAASGG